MARVVAVAAATALLIGMTALAVRQFDDRDTFVPPPVAVAEGFVREVVEKRWARAQTYLAQEVSEEKLRELQQGIEERVGEPTKLEAEELSRGDDEALVNVRLSSEKGSEAVAFGLTFDTEWKIDLP
ncbi:MAG TPA: hypothetical protein VGF28_15120 [Thermoanaerobaculia bacterium]|jgi:TolA-binding protein